MVAIGALLAGVLWTLTGLETAPPVARALPVTQAAAHPNVVQIHTDDQRWDTLHVMPEVRRLLVRRGITFRRAFVSNPLCCPSRSTILTGRYSHTTGVYFNRGAYGGWNAFKPSESSTVATALYAIGYRTGLFGKYLNGYAGDDLYVPPGWDRWFAFSQVNGSYFDYEILDNAGGLHRESFGTQPADYSTDVLARNAAAFIRSTPPSVPFFLMVTPYAPHGPPIAAPRHQGDFADAPVALAPSVRERDVSDKPAYIRRRDLADPVTMRRLTRKQWETLEAVDEMVLRIDSALRETGRAGNTLVLFTSDNGVANGEHRWRYKLTPHEESIRVPFVMRFPGRIPAGVHSNALVGNVDIARTITDFTGASLPTDGYSLRGLATGARSSIRLSLVLEHLRATSEVPTYCGIRTPRFLFVRYGTGEEELYDLRSDPYQMVSVVRSRPKKASELRALTKNRCVPVPPGFSW
jgi:arylsulfatase A-like enzyme